MRTPSGGRAEDISATERGLWAVKCPLWASLRREGRIISSSGWFVLQEGGGAPELHMRDWDQVKAIPCACSAPDLSITGADYNSSPANGLSNAPRCTFEVSLLLLFFYFNFFIVWKISKNTMVTRCLLWIFQKLMEPLRLYRQSPE